MKLHLADYFLEAGRNIRSQLAANSGQKQEKKWTIIEEGERLELTEEGMKQKFGEFLREAERLIRETGYHRRDTELAELRDGLQRRD